MKFYILAFVLLSGCDTTPDPKSQEQTLRPATTTKINLLNAEGHTISKRFEPPKDFVRKTESANSFANYLRNLPLHTVGKKVILYNGQLKRNQSAQAAVVKMDVGDHDLQQCADAVMRLRAEFLYKEKRFDEIHFNFTNSFNAQYKTWRSGKGISVSGSIVRWVNSSQSNTSYESFRKYLTTVFMFAGTASLEKEMHLKNIKDIEIGDVFIKGGHPGHAVIVVDLCEDATGHQAIMLAQSYMPAQEIHVLKNPNNATTSPWYKLSEINDVLETPEWTFEKDQLREF